MTTMTDIPALVLATNDEPREAAAFAFTAAEARQTCRSVRLVHVVHGSAPRGPQHPLTYSWEEVEAEGARLLGHARERLEAVADGPVHVTTEVVRGRVVHRLLAVSADASSLVLSRRGLPRHTPRSGVSAALAGRAICPVVSVPRSWRPEDGFVRRVVLALGDLEHPGRLVGHAFELAAAHAAPLLVVHVAERRPVDQLQVEGATTSFRDRFPQVEVTHEVAEGSPEERLLQVRDPRDLLVVGRRDASHPVYEHLGSLTRTLLQSSTVPLVVVPRPQDAH